MSHPKRANSLPYAPSVGGNNEDPELRMYVLINRDVLSLVQAGVQGAHSIAEYSHVHAGCEKYKKWAGKDKTLIFLQATRADLEKMVIGLQTVGKKYAKFIEPDMYDLYNVEAKALSDASLRDGTFTALAVEPMSAVEGRMYFGSFELLK